jgi:RNA polymerase sigma factor (sigma-70 family)
MYRLRKIINGCRKNERCSQRLLYEYYYGYALKISFRYLDTYEEAEELTNDTFLTIFRTLKDFDGWQNEKLDCSLRGWIKEKMIDALIQNFKSSMSQHLPEMTLFHAPRSDYGISADSPCLFRDIISAVRGLPRILRVVFNLHVIDGYAQTEIAETLGITVQAVGCYIRVARQCCKRSFLASNG